MSTSHPAPVRPTKLWEAWAKVARTRGRAPALIEAETGRTWSRSEILQLADALAQGPLAAARGARVGFSLPNGIEWLTVFLGLQRVGAAAIPFDSSLAPAQQDDLATALGAHFVWRDGALHARPGPSRRAGRMSVGKLTSGSTGVARIVRCHAEHLLADGTNIIRTMRLRPGDRNLALIPLGHSYGLGNLIAPLLLQGTPLICARSFVPHQLIQWIKEFEPTVFPTVPAVLRLLADWPRPIDLAPLRLLISAGARLPPETARDFHARFKLAVHNLYGSSETGSVCYDRRGTASENGGAIGTPLEGVEVEITARQRVQVRSAAVASGRGGTFTLPDLGRFNARGELEIIGRAGRVANIGGRNVHPRELETRLAAVPGVSEAWVQVLSSGGRDYLVAAAESKRQPAEIIADFSQRVAAWQRPRFWLVQPRLPRTERGKLDTAELRRKLATNPNEPAATSLSPLPARA